MPVCGLDAASLRCLQEAFADYYSDEATISRPTPVANDQGGQSVTYASVGTSPCSLDPLTGRELTEAMRASAESWWEIQFPVGTDVLVTDRVIIDGETYEVSWTDEGRSDPLELIVKARKVS